MLWLWLDIFSFQRVINSHDCSLVILLDNSIMIKTVTQFSLLLLFLILVTVTLFALTGKTAAFRLYFLSIIWILKGFALNNPSGLLALHLARGSAPWPLSLIIKSGGFAPSTPHRGLRPLDPLGRGPLAVSFLYIFCFLRV